MTEVQRSVVARFSDLDSANKALRRLREAQKNEGLEIRNGAVVVGTADGVMSVTELEDVGLSDVATSALDLMTFLGVGAAKIAAGTALAGGMLLLSSARRAAALGGAVLMMPARMFLDVFESEKVVDALGTTIEPGVCAVVALVDEPATAAQVMAELAESGGEVVEVNVETEE